MLYCGVSAAWSTDPYHNPLSSTVLCLYGHRRVAMLRACDHLGPASWGLNCAVVRSAGNYTACAWAWGRVMWSASIRYMDTYDRRAYVRMYVHCTVCCYSTGSICHSSLLHPEGWRSWKARPWRRIHMTQSPLWHQVLRMWWVGGAPESAESDQGGSPGDKICNKHLNTYWLTIHQLLRNNPLH